MTTAYHTKYSHLTLDQFIEQVSGVLDDQAITYLKNVDKQIDKLIDDMVDYGQEVDAVVERQRAVLHKAQETLKAQMDELKYTAIKAVSISEALDDIEDSLYTLKGD